MSFILDALKKSESERQRADTPALYEMKMAPKRPGVATWLIVLGALLVINVVVLSVVLLRGTHSAAPQIDAGTAAPPPAVNPPPMASPATAPSLSAAPAGAAAAPDPPPPDSAGGGAANPADDDAPAVDPPRSVAAAANGDLPSYEQLASAPGADLPELKLDLHSYSGNPADRFVYLNMQNLREGQTTPAGVRIESITPEGAILSWRGSRFFLHRQ